jgi:hypothetical protein
VRPASRAGFHDKMSQNSCNHFGAAGNEREDERLLLEQERAHHFQVRNAVVVSLRAR